MDVLEFGGGGGNRKDVPCADAGSHPAELLENTALGEPPKVETPVETSPGCRLFDGPLDSHGYGRVCVDGRERAAHRVAWEEAFGPIPDGLCVLHACDTPACIEPRHLLLGTHTANMLDRDRKGRHAEGTRNGRAKLTPREVLCIRALGRARRFTQAEIATIFRVNYYAVVDILRRKTWAHLPPEEP